VSEIGVPLTGVRLAILVAASGAFPLALAPVIEHIEAQEIFTMTQDLVLLLIRNDRVVGPLEMSV
jgi:hypothetical protein